MGPDDLSHQDPINHDERGQNHDDRCHDQVHHDHHFGTNHIHGSRHHDYVRFEDDDLRFGEGHHKQSHHDDGREDDGDHGRLDDNQFDGDQDFRVKADNNDLRYGDLHAQDVSARSMRP